MVKTLLCFHRVADTKCISNNLVGTEEIELRPIYSLNSDNQVGFCTVQSYKGLEAPVIVITDIDTIRSRNMRALFYTAISRALDRLIILSMTVSGNLYGRYCFLIAEDIDDDRSYIANSDAILLALSQELVGPAPAGDELDLLKSTSPV